MSAHELDKSIKRWRLMLGEDVQQQLCGYGSCELSDSEIIMDRALGAIYSRGDSFQYAERSAGKGKSSPNIARWLGDIRSYFKDDLVSVIQADAIEKKGLKQLLFEPETLRNVKPDLGMVSTLIALKGHIPEKAKDAARGLVKTVVEEINALLEQSVRMAVSGAINRKENSPIPSAVGIDWKRTIRKNVKNYNNELKTIIPDRFYFFGRSQHINKWTVIVDIDQSGSMAPSVVYGSILGCIFSSISSLKTHVVAFDTDVVDLSERYGSDPVDMLFGIQLGGGTDINKSVAYCEQFITNPKNTLFIVITDLYEGGNQSELIARMEQMVSNGVKVIGLMALSDEGYPDYNKRLAKILAGFGVPCFACTPRVLPEMIEGALKGRDLMDLAEKLTKKTK